MACLKPDGYSGICLLTPACPATNGGVPLSYRAGDSTCVYSDSSTITYAYAFPMPESQGGGMTESQLQQLLDSDKLGVFAIVMVIFAIGVALGFKFTQQSSRYTEP